MVTIVTMIWPGECGRDPVGVLAAFDARRRRRVIGHGERRFAWARDIARPVPGCSAPRDSTGGGARLCRP